MDKRWSFGPWRILLLLCCERYPIRITYGYKRGIVISYLPSMKSVWIKFHSWGFPSVQKADFIFSAIIFSHPLLNPKKVKLYWIFLSNIFNRTLTLECNFFLAASYIFWTSFLIKISGSGLNGRKEQKMNTELCLFLFSKYYQAFFWIVVYASVWMCNSLVKMNRTAYLVLLRVAKLGRKITFAVDIYSVGIEFTSGFWLRGVIRTSGFVMDI